MHKIRIRSSFIKVFDSKLHLIQAFSSFTMPKALQRLPLLQTFNLLQLIDSLNSDSDSDIQEDIIFLDMITSQRYINPCRRYPSDYMYTMNDLQTLSSEKF